MSLSRDGSVLLIPSLMGTEKEGFAGQLHTEWHGCDFLQQRYCTQTSAMLGGTTGYMSSVILRRPGKLHREHGRDPPVSSMCLI